ncbi:MAG TPA: DUF2752 domain-containing protein [Terriglobales bacterium]|jgi:hypothetical protein|nr:DUF2752 domain-containing protein [Terriglobales bacterium]
MRWRFHLATAASLAAAASLYWLPPWRYSFYPRCPFFALTGMECPGCGMTRALAALLDGQFAVSWHYNPLAILLLPPLAVYFFTGYWRGISRRDWSIPQLPSPVLAMLFVSITLFGVARNLPGMGL